MIPSQAFREYGDAVARQAEEASARLRTFMEAIEMLGDVSNEFLRNSVIDFMGALVYRYGTVAAVLAADFYNETAASAGVRVDDALIAEVDYDAAVSGSVKYAARRLFDQNPDTEAFKQACMAAVSRFVKKAANDTVSKNCVRDRRKGARFARVPSGTETCAFCLMLASRGFVYASKDTAGEFDHFHDGCDCKIVAGFGDDAGVEGYEHGKYLEMYEDALAYDAYELVDLDETLNSMRRSMYGTIKDRRNARRRELRAARQARGQDGESS